MTLMERLSGADRWWAVQHSEGWCATKTGMRPGDGADSVPTLCGQFVILPGGVRQGETDCPECLAALRARGIS